MELEVRPSALEHGVSGAAIAVRSPLLIDYDFEGKYSPKVLVLGPDSAGNIIEIFGEFSDEQIFGVFHAMPARPKFLKILARAKEE